MSNNTHAAMCVYCGDAIIYDTREVTDMAAAHAQIVEHDQQCPKNPLVARIAELERYNLGLTNQSCELQERVARLNNALTRQANAATLGMDAAQAVASSNLEQAKRLHAESSPEALESEREANARLTELSAKLEQERDALAAHVEALSSNAVALADACENKTDLPLHKWAVKCAMLVSRVYKAAEEKPTTTLRHHDASILREYAEKLEADEAPDAEAGDMWDASQCADWMREQAEKAEGHQ